MTPLPRYIHASAALIGEAAVLVRGASGIGKSTLVRQLIVAGRAEGRFCRLVGDDRIGVAARGGRLVATPHPGVAGRIESAGQGIFAAPHVDAAVVRLVVDLADSVERMPPQGRRATIEGVSLPLIVADPRSPATIERILAEL